MRNSSFILTLGFLCACAPAYATEVGEGDPSDVVSAFTQAQSMFNQAALAKLTTDDYFEISPVGEVDPKDKVLSFYPPGKREAGPPATLTETTTRRTTPGEALVVTGVKFPERRGRPAFRMRATFLLRSVAGAWKIFFAQYTPVRSPGR